MYRYHSPQSLLSFVVIVAIVLVGYLVLETIDRLTASPAMRRRVNAGSDKFFIERGSIWQAAVQSTKDWLQQFSSRRF